MHCRWTYKSHKTFSVNSTLILDSFTDISHKGEGGALTVEGDGGVLSIIECYFEECCCKSESYSPDFAGDNDFVDEENDKYSFDGCGGAICVSSISKNINLLVNGSRFLYCEASNDGGAICAKCCFELEDSSFDKCIAENGNGGGCVIFSSKDISFIETCKFFNCCSGPYLEASETNDPRIITSFASIGYLHGGGALCFVSLEDTIAIRSCEFLQCFTSNGRGGAVFLCGKPAMNSFVKFERCRFYLNTANEHGQDVAAVSLWENSIRCREMFFACESNSLEPKVSIGENDKDGTWMTGECDGIADELASDGNTDVFIATAVCCFVLFFIVFVVKMVSVLCEYSNWASNDAVDLSTETLTDEDGLDSTPSETATPNALSPDLSQMIGSDGSSNENEYPLQNFNDGVMQ
eukprot:MONOS_14077.1-p1 / transcript=MONOS_14077.1 / gene=MONOS_14077 / organism=Monocercomonoides_exilis_PA203 / gene_product=unspecified product / transcript_product=unspecified product / location=Mono_scaffold00933:1376-2599(+) / protein_length=408 / sequence_SO=supercontig / SO=protein_coding / is_pseudo=false